MKKLLLVAVATLSLAFLASVVLSVAFLAGLDQIWSSQSEREDGDKAVAVLLPAERDPFWEDLVAALRREGGRLKIAFEVARYSPSGTNALETFEKTVLSQVDAVVCFPPEGLDVTEVVNAGEERGLPVLLLENDLPQSKRRVFLGASTFQMGHEVGRLIRGLPGRVQRAGVLLSQTNRDRQTVRNSLFLNGMSEGLSGMGRDFSLEEVISPPGRFAGEELVWDLLRREPTLQVLVTTNSKDTSSALQTIVEANRVGKTVLVGVGEDQSLRTALEQGLIEGLITRDATEWARTISGTLATVFAGETVSSYVNLPIHPLKRLEAGDGS